MRITIFRLDWVLILGLKMSDVLKERELCFSMKERRE